MMDSKTVNKAGYVLSIVVFICLLGASWTLFISSTSAQEIIELTTDTNSFKEHYDRSVPVSGGAIVGIRLGRHQGPISIDNILFPAFLGEELCVRSVTQDGRYSANNIYRPTKKIHAGSLVKLAPVTLKYAGLLSSYSYDTFAVNAFLATDGRCDPNNATHIPLLDSDSEGFRKLSVFINASGRASQMRIGKYSTSVNCTPSSEGARIAYDTQCDMDLPPHVSDAVSVQILMDDGFDKEVLHFNIILPTGL